MRLFDISLIMNFILKRFYFVIPFALVAIYLIYQRYSEQKINKLNEKFEIKTLFVRRLWGWVAALTFLVPMILFALLVNHVI